MAQTGPSRILEVLNNPESSQQQYVEVGSNIYVGTQDGIKYSIFQTPDNKLGLVEIPSDSNMSLTDSCRSFGTFNENSTISNMNVSESLSESKEIKIISMKAHPSPCKGQGDEIGNTVISPLKTLSNLKRQACSTSEKIKQESTSESLDSSSSLTYTTLYPKQDKNQLVTYYVTPPSTISSYSPTFPSPIFLRPPRQPRKPRMPTMSAPSQYTPQPRIRRGAPRMRRPRKPVYEYTPQMMHSTPKTLTHSSYSSGSSISFSDGSSGSLSGSSSNKSNLSIEYPRVPNNTPTSSEEVSASNQQVFSLQWMPYIENYASGDPREAHNDKERHRRLRIKNACQYMRGLMPWITDKIDNATVFEEAVNFIAYLRETAGCEFNIEFVEENYNF